MTAYVYRLVHRPSGYFYIGSTSDLAKRKLQLMRSLAAGCHQNVSLQRFYDKKHKKNWEFESISVPNRKAAYKRERLLITKYLDDPKLMNIGKGSFGGDNLSRHPDKERIIAKMTRSTQKWWDEASGEFRENHKETRRGVNNPMYGRTHSLEARNLISVANIGRPGWALGKKFTKEHRAKISENAKKRTGEKNPFYGRKHSEESLEKMRISSKKRDTSFLDVQRKRISVDGIIYRSLSEASKAVGMPRPTLSWRAHNEKPIYSNIFYLN